MYDVCRWTFNSDRKRMSVMVRRDAGFVLFTKGAPDFMRRDLVSYLRRDGTVAPLSETDVDAIYRSQDAMAGRGLRTLLLAYRAFDKDEGWVIENPPDSELVFVGMIGIKDPVRASVPDAVRRCKVHDSVVKVSLSDSCCLCVGGWYHCANGDW